MSGAVDQKKNFLSLGDFNTETITYQILLKDSEKFKVSNNKWNRKVEKRLSTTKEKKLRKEFEEIVGKKKGDQSRALSHLHKRISRLINGAVMQFDAETKVAEHFVKVAAHLNYVADMALNCHAELNLKTVSKTHASNKEKIERISEVLKQKPPIMKTWKMALQYLLHELDSEGDRELMVQKMIKDAIDKGLPAFDNHKNLASIKAALESKELDTAFERYELVKCILDLTQMKYELFSLQSYEIDRSIDLILDPKYQLKKGDKKWNRKVLKRVNSNKKKELEAEFLKIYENENFDAEKTKLFFINKIFLLINCGIERGEKHFIDVAFHFDKVLITGEKEIKDLPYKKQLDYFRHLFETQTFNFSWKNELALLLATIKPIKQGHVRLRERIKLAIREGWNGFEKYQSVEDIIEILSSKHVNTSYIRYELTGKLHQLISLNFNFRSLETIKKLDVPAIRMQKFSMRILDQKPFIERASPWLDLAQSKISQKNSKAKKSNLQKEVLKVPKISIPESLSDLPNETYTCSAIQQKKDPSKLSLKSSLNKFRELRGLLKNEKDPQERAQFYLQLLEFELICERVKPLLPLNLTIEQVKINLQNTGNNRDLMVNFLNEIYEKHPNFFILDFDDKLKEILKLGHLETLPWKFCILLDEGKTIEDLLKLDAEALIQEMYKKKGVYLADVFRENFSKIYLFLNASIWLCDYRWQQYGSNLYDAMLRIDSKDKKNSHLETLFLNCQGNNLENIPLVSNLFKKGINRKWKKKCWIFIKLLKLETSSFKERIKLLFGEKEEKGQVEKRRSLSGQDAEIRKQEVRENLEENNLKWKALRDCKNVEMLIGILENSNLLSTLKRYEIVMDIIDFLKSNYYLHASEEDENRVNQKSKIRKEFSKNPKKRNPLALRNLLRQENNVADLAWLDLAVSQKNFERSCKKEQNKGKLLKLQSFNLPNKLSQICKPDEKGKEKCKDEKEKESDQKFHSSESIRYENFSLMEEPRNDLRKLKEDYLKALQNPIIAVKILSVFEYYEMNYSIEELKEILSSEDEKNCFTAGTIIDILGMVFLGNLRLENVDHVEKTLRKSFRISKSEGEATVIEKDFSESSSSEDEDVFGKGSW